MCLTCNTFFKCKVIYRINKYAVNIQKRSDSFCCLAGACRAEKPYGRSQIYIEFERVIDILVAWK